VKAVRVVDAEDQALAARVLYYGPPHCLQEVKRFRLRTSAAYFRYQRGERTEGNRRSRSYGKQPTDRAGVIHILDHRPRERCLTYSRGACQDDTASHETNTG
jgi:hypothetical protein